MAKIRLHPKVMFSLDVSLTEEEARALEALAGYNTDDFLKVFYEHMGRSYMSPNEAGLRSLFESVRNQLSHQLHEIDRVRKTLETL